MTARFEPHMDDTGIRRVEVSFDSPLTIPQFLKWMNSAEHELASDPIAPSTPAHKHELITVPFVGKGEVVSVAHYCLYCPYTDKREKV